jgi:cyclic beta-1,2-glucan synthetase
MRRSLSVFGRVMPKSPWDDSNVIREVIFSSERLESHAQSLAKAQAIRAYPQKGRPLLDRLAQNEASLLVSYQSICGAVSVGAAITPAAEWLIDNFHQVERQVREIRTDLPPGYYRQLPKLAEGPFERYPRVFEIAWAYVAHTDSRFDVVSWCGFLRAYQEVQYLTIGELWASAITLRLVLIENLRRIADRVVYSRNERSKADELADRLLGVDGRNAEPSATIEMELERTELPDAFLVQLIHRLRDQGAAAESLLTHIDKLLTVSGRTVEDSVRDEQERQIAANATVRNIITSMRHMSDVDWTVIFERINLVDGVLANGCCFREMDFPTRDMYRTAIEELARGSNLGELEVARRAVQIGVQASSDSLESDGRRTDPGYHLCGGGRVEFEVAIGFRARPQVLVGRFYRALGIGGYVGAGVIVAGLLLALPIIAHAEANAEWIWLGLLGTLGAIPALDAAVALVNQGITHRFGATQLPGMELKDGVPKSLRTLVVVPVLLTTRQALDQLIGRLEIHYLASQIGDLQFALLSDWTDAPSETAEGDEELLQATAEGIARLNHQHGPAPGGDRFLLLHRRRVWNESQRRWIGWERKRGKLHELNRLLRGAFDTTFISTDGHPPRVPQNVRYVITLDADTMLPRDTVRRLIGKMAHPLNQPRLDNATNRVIEGHAVLQPRVTAALPIGAEGSLYQRAFASLGGIDPYAAAMSDVYQDLFEEGSYTGKGIYAVDAFEAALADRTPDSTLLSHDLFEGVFARAGLASDVEVVEAYPTRYDVAALRYHRWARGDWQLLPWILGWSVLLGEARKRSAMMPASGRWKMVDNLRRTSSPIICLLALMAGWLLPFDAAVIWTVFVLGTIALPSFAPVLAATIVPRNASLSLRHHIRSILTDFRGAFLQFMLIIVFLAHQAWLMSDAIIRTLWRLFITRHDLLEWTPASQASIGRKPTLLAYYRWMQGAVFIGLAAPVAAWISGDQTWLIAAPLGILWIVSPAIAYWVGLPSSGVAKRLPTPEDVQALRLIARRTWRFFETFVTKHDQMLPPDNFQEDPSPVLAHRTSPTNLGLYLLSTASAHDFGWLGIVDTIERLEATLSTMGSLARFHGHFYNWYDTTDLRPLDPQYVSTVDSGNLAGHLIALANACDSWSDLSLSPNKRLEGIGDALDLVRGEIDNLRDSRRTETVTWRQFDETLALAVSQVRSPLLTPETIAERLARLSTIADNLADITRAFAIERDDTSHSDLLFWVEAARKSIVSHHRDVTSSVPAETRSRLAAIGEIARKMTLSMEFGFLLNTERMLLSIGFVSPQGALDENCYDLLASEARLASYVGIAKGDLPARHWFHLAHDITPVGADTALISWSGSMFEYLMPSLVMRAPTMSALEQTNRVIVRRQIEYGASLGTPWGISESAYNARDPELTYQYSNFGVPGLGLKRGLSQSVVVAPYATALAAIVDPTAAARNFERLASEGGRGRFGWFEALDYTPGRLPQGQSVAVVRAFMAHHQGMTIVAIADALMKGVTRARFHTEPMIRAAELLLQERMPREVAVRSPWASEASVEGNRKLDSSATYRRADPQAPTPATHLLSNGRYSVMLTAAGSGYSRWRDLAVTRWREDGVCDDWGSYIYLRDVESDRVWSASLQPVGAEPDHYEVDFSEDRASFSRQDGELHTILDVVVSAEDDAEVRRVTISNSGARARELEVTSYAEVVIAPQAADASHPAFSKLFVQTEYLTGPGAILTTRRRRSPTEAEVWAAHHSVAEGDGVGKAEFETSRGRFLGRGRDVRGPAAVIDGRLLSGSTGAVLDPIFALRRRVRILPGATVRIAFWTMAAESRANVVDVVDKTNDISAFDRAATLAWTKAQVQLHHLGIDRAEASLFQQLAGHLLYAAPALRPSSETILRGAGSQPGLWPLGISGDLPIILFRISNVEDIRVARQVLRAMEYWRNQRLEVDLVIVNERAPSYVQDLQTELENLVRTNQARPPIVKDVGGGQIFVLRADIVSTHAVALLQSVARVVLRAERGGLAEQLKHIATADSSSRVIREPRVLARPQPVAVPRQQLEYFNGLGGFANDGKEYVTILGPGQTTPAPWINVVSNPAFGFQISAEGAGFTWSVNSREHQLTSWSNDPVTDLPSEAIYLRDEDTDELWCPTASPIRDETAAYVATHGWGYSRFEHEAHGIALELLAYVPRADSVKISRLKLRNTTSRRRRLSVTAYVEWTLGASRATSAPFISTEIDATSGAMFARNPWNAAFGSRVAFLDMGGRQMNWTGDRREFIGRNGCLADPAALAHDTKLSGAVGAGRDPCGALQTAIEMAAGEDIEIVVLLGDTADAAEATRLIAHYRQADLDAVLTEVRDYWEGVLQTVQVKTPDRSMDIMLNGWLLYQTIACRIWARSGFYQSSGAYGFRDQLQDGMALGAVQPTLSRDHLVRAASRQFVEGDVQHWWLPHSGQGVRTRISDDKAWLAYATAHYVRVTGDAKVLDETVPYLEGTTLTESEDDRFFVPATSDKTATLYDHCALALDSSLALGPHGLPLMGAGDWNDGMNRVGREGRGESVWLAWLLHATLTDFAGLADARGDKIHAGSWRKHTAELKQALEREAWDGEWYRRAWFDDGTVLGSASNDECRIDSIAQSWAVISGAADAQRAAQAMAAVERELIDNDDGLALLFTPPFDRFASDPGYIKAYPPGIRENGGQYTHAAAWSVIALACLGEGTKAGDLFWQLNPINHARTRAELRRYKVEPYVIAADVYAAPHHVGHGGWTWYTGSAGWMQRAGLESILGLQCEGSSLHIDPCIPNSWPGFEIWLRRRSAQLHIKIENPNGVTRGIAAARMDGTLLTQRPLRFELADDHLTHELSITLG